MPEITSRQHPIVRSFRAAAKGEDPRALIDGWHLLHEAAAADLSVDTVAIVGTPATNADATLIDELARHASVIQVTEAVMNALSPVRTPAGVAALVHRREADPTLLMTPTPPLILVAFDLQDPGNVGAVVRAADAGGATGVVFAGASADPWGWKALRAGMGSTFRLPVIRQRDPSLFLAMLRRSKVATVATVPRAGESLYDVDLRIGTAILLGGEGGGLDRTLVDGADRRMTIPMEPDVESLNVAVAAGVVVYEARRQRLQRG